MFLSCIYWEFLVSRFLSQEFSQFWNSVIWMQPEPWWTESGHSFYVGKLGIEFPHHKDPTSLVT